MIDKLVSKKAQNIKSYKVESKVPGIMLDKNENPWYLDGAVRQNIIKRLENLELNRYPDNNCTELKEELSTYTGASTDSIIVGNGSDELIHMVFQTFLNPGDKIAVQSPTFSMYKIYADLCDADTAEYVLKDSFEPDPEGFLEFLKKENPKIAIICNPNNPTGKSFELPAIDKILKEFRGLLLLDEAYFEFSGITAAGLLPEYENLVILRTLSKAFGLAGLRVGYLLGNPALAGFIERVRPPFNVNSFSQAAAVEVLKNKDNAQKRIEEIKAEREKLAERLNGLDKLECLESWANFVLVRSERAGEIYRRLEEARIYVKGFSAPALKNCLRVTVGSPRENDILFEAVKEVLYEGA